MGEQTRSHSDLDVWLPAGQFDRLTEAAVSIGVDQIFPWPGDRPWNFVLHDGGALRLDLHVYEALDDGTLHYGSIATGANFPRDALGGHGEIDGTAVVCEAPEWVRRWRTGYPLRPVDRDDMARLCERYGFELPSEYQ